MDGLALAADAGAPTARDALRHADFKFGNELIAAAVKVRRERLSRTTAAAGEDVE
jgi:hypothetical protein